MLIESGSGGSAFLRMSGAERREFLEACLVLGILRAAIALLPFKRIVGGPAADPDAAAPPACSVALARAERIGRMVGRAARHTPWASTCLAQALATQWMLHRRGVGSVLVLGARLDADAGHPLAAHAWVICGDRVVTGRAGHSHYRALAKFIR